MFHHNISFYFNGKEYFVSPDFMNYSGDYRRAKAEMVEKFGANHDIKANIAEYSDKIMPIIFGQQAADELLTLFHGDSAALFYRVSPWIRRRLYPMMKKEIRKRKRQYLRILGE